MRGYCDAQFPDNPLFRCSLDPDHAGDRHEAYDENDRLLASWEVGYDFCDCGRQMADHRDLCATCKAARGRQDGVAAGLAAFSFATLHRSYVMPRVTR